VKLVPAGIIPRDPGLRLKLQRAPAAATVSETPKPVPVAACTATGATAMFASFNFTGNLPDYVSDSGAVFTLSSGNTAADTYLVENGVLRRQDFSEGPDSGGESWAYTDQQPATTRFYIEATITFKGLPNGPDPEFSALYFYQNATAPGNPDVLCGLSSQGLGVDASLLGFQNIAYTTLPNTPYVMRLFVDGHDLTLCINGSVVATAALGADLTLPVGIDTFNFGGANNFAIDDLRIVDVP